MIAFTVYGRPEPQGSSRAFMLKGKPQITSTNAKLKPFRHTVTQVALEAVGKIGAAPLFGRHVPVRAHYIFTFRRPAGVPKGRVFPVVKPDMDKLERAVNDALTGVVFHDDSQVVSCTSDKVYGDVEGVFIQAQEVSN